LQQKSSVRPSGQQKSFRSQGSDAIEDAGVGVVEDVGVGVVEDMGVGVVETVGGQSERVSAQVPPLHLILPSRQQLLVRVHMLDWPLFSI
jgi:hypothetical protein